MKRIEITLSVFLALVVLGLLFSQNEKATIYVDVIFLILIIFLLLREPRSKTAVKNINSGGSENKTDAGLCDSAIYDEIDSIILSQIQAGEENFISACAAQAEQMKQRGDDLSFQRVIESRLFRLSMAGKIAKTHAGGSWRLTGRPAKPAKK